MRDHLTIPARFNGPDGSGNGGYVAGRLAALLSRGGAAAGPVQVTLRRPPPLGTELALATDDATLELRDGAHVVAEAVGVPLGASPPAAVDPAEARSAARGFPGRHDHPFPRCFSCGPLRPEHDGLGIGAGPVGDGRFAAPWVPDRSVSAADGSVLPEICWAALDCSGGWAAGVSRRPMVLGRITAELSRLPAVGEPCVVVALHRGVDGRKHTAATALYGADGDLLGRAEQVWLTVDVADFSAADFRAAESPTGP